VCIACVRRCKLTAARDWRWCANECSQFSREKARAEADGTKRFEFDYVFEPTTSQDEVFNTMGRPVLKVCTACLPAAHGNIVLSKLESERAERVQYSAPVVLQEVLRGYNGTILAYGQTGSGKTHTLLNVAESASEVGLVQYPYPFVSRLRLHFVRGDRGPCALSLFAAVSASVGDDASHA
jgi:hypothetical protein